MKMMLALVALIGLIAHPAMAAVPGDTGAKELATGQKRNQEKPAATQTQEGSMAGVPAGEFMMGSPTGDSDEQPAHKVYVDSFSMDKYEVTVGQYAAFLQAKGIDPPSDWKTMNRSEHQKRPVANVDWADAFAFCKWAGKRLPTEAEWECAARGGLDGADYAWGDEFLPHDRHMANTWQGEFPWRNTASDGYDGTSPVGVYDPNGYGLYDMIGNVWEWTTDWYEPSHPGEELKACCIPRNPRGGREDASYDPCQPNIPIPRKVLKGGSHLCAPNYCRRYRPAARHAEPIDTSTSHVGFRCVRRNRIAE